MTAITNDFVFQAKFDGALNDEVEVLCMKRAFDALNLYDTPQLRYWHFWMVAANAQQYFKPTTEVSPLSRASQLVARIPNLDRDCPVEDYPQRMTVAKAFTSYMVTCSFTAEAMGQEFILNVKR